MEALNVTEKCYRLLELNYLDQLFDSAHIRTEILPRGFLRAVDSE
jgi:hypothetical protein